MAYIEIFQTSLLSGLRLRQLQMQIAKRRLQMQIETLIAEENYFEFLIQIIFKVTDIIAILL